MAGSETNKNQPGTKTQKNATFQYKAKPCTLGMWFSLAPVPQPGSQGLMTHIQMSVSLRGHRDRIHQSDNADPSMAAIEDAALRTRCVTPQHAVHLRVYFSSDARMLFIWVFFAYLGASDAYSTANWPNLK